MKLLNKYLVNKRDSGETVTIRTSDGRVFRGDVIGWDKRVIRLNVVERVVAANTPYEDIRQYAEPMCVILFWRKVVSIF